MAKMRSAPRSFESTRMWIFDLDNTLYPVERNWFAQVDQKMAEFIARYLGVPFAYARHLQYLSPAIRHHARLHDAGAQDGPSCLDYVHYIDLTPVPEHPELRAAIDALPGCKSIFTAGSHGHAERVAGSSACSIRSRTSSTSSIWSFIPKEKAEAYHRLLKSHYVVPEASAMFEDMPHNLEPAYMPGMTTVLVHSATSTTRSS